MTAPFGCVGLLFVGVLLLLIPVALPNLRQMSYNVWLGAIATGLGFLRGAGDLPHFPHSRFPRSDRGRQLSTGR
ncbi:MAG: hypothetical protein R2856_37495 [Caldilineaceae bacterium]